MKKVRKLIFITEEFNDKIKKVSEEKNLSQSVLIEIVLSKIIDFGLIDLVLASDSREKFYEMLYENQTKTVIKKEDLEEMMKRVKEHLKNLIIQNYQQNKSYEIEPEPYIMNLLEEIKKSK